MNIDFKNMQTYQYFVACGLAVAVLALLGYFFSAGKIRLPTIIAASLSFLVVGVGAGVLLLGAVGYNWKAKPQDPEFDNPPAILPQAQEAPKDGPKMPGRVQANMGQSTANKTQLVQLVTKLNQLTEKPLAISLDAERKKLVAAQIKDLNGLPDLSENDAKKRVEALHELLKDDKKTLEAVGYRWTTGKAGFGGGGKQSPNPFKDEANGKELKALVDRVEK